MRLLVLLVGLAGCVGVGGDPSASDQNALTRELAGRVTGETKDCVSSSSSRALRAVDERTLVYERGATLWVNRLRSECPGVRPLSTLIVETEGSRYCRGDRIRGLESGSIIPGPTCVLGQFVAYRLAQAR
jgi:hypothetical protein